MAIHCCPACLFLPSVASVFAPLAYWRGDFRCSAVCCTRNLTCHIRISHVFRSYCQLSSWNCCEPYFHTRFADRCSALSEALGAASWLIRIFVHRKPEAILDQPPFSRRCSFRVWTRLSLSVETKIGNSAPEKKRCMSVTRTALIFQLLSQGSAETGTHFNKRRCAVF